MARNLVRADPFAQLSALTREMFDSGFRPTQSRMPTTDVYTEDGEALIVEAHLPNFQESEISVVVDGGALVIQAERREKEEDKKKEYVIRESSTSFYRSVVLPEQADESKITATFVDGVLKVRVPLTESTVPRRISIAADGG